MFHVKSYNSSVYLMTDTLLVILLLGTVPESPIQAQTSSPLAARVYDADSGSWSSDGRYFVFQNGGLGWGFETDKPSWVEYDTLTGQITINRCWPPIGIADLQTGQHIVTDLPTMMVGLSDYLGGVRWSGDSSTFTVKTVTDDAATYIYYITNLNQPVFAPKLLTIAPGAPPNLGFISGIPTGTDTRTAYRVYAISFDGQKPLLDGVSYGPFWNRAGESQDRTIPMPNDFVRDMGFDSQNLKSCSHRKPKEYCAVRFSYFASGAYRHQPRSVYYDRSILGRSCLGCARWQACGDHEWYAEQRYHAYSRCGVDELTYFIPKRECS
ncbi:MAG: hypothetical protein ACYDBJ_22510 [Aggregatilineales bacterium]